MCFQWKSIRTRRRRPQTVRLGKKTSNIDQNCWSRRSFTDLDSFTDEQISVFNGAESPGMSNQQSLNHTMDTAPWIRGEFLPLDRSQGSGSFESTGFQCKAKPPQFLESYIPRNEVPSSNSINHRNQDGSLTRAFQSFRRKANIGNSKRTESHSDLESEDTQDAVSAGHKAEIFKKEGKEKSLPRKSTRRFFSTKKKETSTNGLMQRERNMAMKLTGID